MRKVSREKYSYEFTSRHFHVKITCGTFACVQCISQHHIPPHIRPNKWGLLIKKKKKKKKNVKDYFKNIQLEKNITD